MPKICPGVEFEILAREWRCKWDEGNDKKSLEEAQKALEAVMPKVAAVKGSKVQRIVCGGCKDFKVIVSLKEDKFKEWEADKFAPEEDFLTALKAISGIKTVETQTYTLQSMRYTPPEPLKKPKVWEIGRLKPDAKSFNLEAKVLSDGTEKETTKGAKVMEFTIGDKSGKIVVSCKDDQVDLLKSMKDKVCMFRNGQVRMVKGHMRLIVDKWGKIEASADTTIDEIGDKDVSEKEYELVKA